MHKYKIVEKKGEGTFSEVLMATCTRNSKSVAIKCMKNRFDSVEQVNRLREIQALRKLSPHPNIIKLYEVLYDRSTGRLALVFELMEMNIYEMIKNRRQYVAEERVLHYMYQLMKSMEHMHKIGIFHRDIKPENVLVNQDTLKLADFGSCRGIYSKQPFTEYISTRWYRAPECLLTDGWYNFKMDMWGIGCVMFEVMALFPLFPGQNELDQIHKIHAVVGTPEQTILDKFRKHSSHIEFDFTEKPGTGIPKLIPHVRDDALDLIQKLLAYNPDDRLSAKHAIRHAYFKEIRELERKQRQRAKEQKELAKSLEASSQASGNDSTVGAGESSRLPSLPQKGASVGGRWQDDDTGGNKGKDSSTLPNLPPMKGGSSAPPPA